MANYPNYNLFGKRPADTYRNIVQFNITASNLVDSYGDELPPLTISASVSGTSSWADNSVNAISASWAPDQTVTVNSASWASQSLSASWAPFTDTGTTLVTGSTYDITSSWSDNSLSASYAPTTEQVSSSWASSSLSSSVAVSASWAPTSITYPLTTLAVNDVSYSIDFASGQYFQLDTTGSEFTFGDSAGVVAVRNASVYITPQSGSRTIVFHPSWIVMGNFPTTITHNSASILSLTTFGSDDTSVVAAFASKV